MLQVFSQLSVSTNNEDRSVGICHFTATETNTTNTLIYTIQYTREIAHFVYLHLSE